MPAVGEAITHRRRLGKLKKTQPMIIHYKHNHTIQADYSHPNLLYNERK